MPVVAIVGRPNVGKSSLLNALSGKTISIVQDMPGVTRDRVDIPLKIQSAMPLGDRYVNLVDTGGYGFEDQQGLTDHIKAQIEHAMNQADLVLFIVDAAEGLTHADHEVATLLRRKGIRAILIGNKADSPKADVNLADFARLGLGTPVGVSAMTGRNIDAIDDAIRKHVDLSKAPATIPDPSLMVAIVGKRNAGKSTLVNAIAEIYEGAGHGDRVIVSEVAGTTRDSVDVRFEKEGKSLVVIDTAGVRKMRHMVTNDIEFYSFHRAQRSVRRADVVLMLIDGRERVSDPDKKLGAYIAEQFKPVILVVNKWDLVLEDARRQAEEKGTGFSPDLLANEFREYLDEELRELTYAPVAFVTAKDGRKVEAVIDLCQHLHKQASERVGTGELNRVVHQILEERKPPTRTGLRPRVFYVTQPEVSPPTIVLFVNNPDWISEEYKRFMINRFRELLPYAEVPIKLLIRGREGKPSKEKAAAALAEQHGKATAPKGAKRPAAERGKRPAPAAKGATRPTAARPRKKTTRTKRR